MEEKYREDQRKDFLSIPFYGLLVSSASFNKITKKEGEAILYIPISLNKKRIEEFFLVAEAESYRPTSSIYVNNGVLWIARKGPENLYGLNLLSSEKEECCIFIRDKDHRPSIILDINPKHDLIVGSFGTITDFDGKQLILFNEIEKRGIDHFASISALGERIYLYVVGGSFNNNKVIEYFPQDKEFGDFVLDFRGANNYITSTKLLGCSNSGPLFITTHYLQYLSINNDPIEGTCLHNEDSRFYRVAVIENNFPHSCFVAAYGRGIPVILYYIDIEKRMAQEIIRIPIDYNVEKFYFSPVGSFALFPITDEIYHYALINAAKEKFSFPTDDQ